MWASAKFSSRPDRQRIFDSLTRLFDCILEQPGKKGLVIPFEWKTGKFIIFSDQHKGARNGADDFKLAEPNYIAAMEYYAGEDFYFINLGDSEELWENSFRRIKKWNKAVFEAEKKFIANNKYIKIFGNHDLYWNTSPMASFNLKEVYGEKIKVYEGVILPVSIGTKTLSICCTHGHQGDASSDGSWFSKFFVAWIWAPLQAFIRVNPNTPAYDYEKKSLHNNIMYEWSSEQKGLLLITGHTHQPVFSSLTHLERLYKKSQEALARKDEAELMNLKEEIRKREKEYTAVSVDYLQMKPTYYNSGCCCFSDGDITGIEIAEGKIRLIKWEDVDEKPQRSVLEEVELADLVV
jgi:UDP-2,3-diacylglucosamine pyrophosphatase LpxH